MKKIGFITMHQVQNFGSILQSYALQQKINELGVSNEIIDFNYPPQPPKTFIFFLKNFIQIFIDFCFGFPLKRKNKRFKEFYDNNLKLTEKSYTKDSLEKNPPVFDLYLSGSDQVWNPNFIKEDTSFLLSFVPDDKPRASYSSSFAINKIPKEFYSIYAKELNKFSRITVREQSGISIVKELTCKDAQLVCDPTLLLDKQSWNKVAANSKIKIREKYILVYILAYMYNPYPEIYNIVDKVQKELGNLKVIYLVGKKDDIFRSNSRLIKDAGPNEFVYLFQNAEFVITTSFHGTAFSLIFGRPLYAVVKDLNSADGRMPTLLKQVNCENAIISYDSEEVASKSVLLKQYCDDSKLEKFRVNSELILKDIINSCLKS